MSTINVKLLAETYAALVVAEGHMRDTTAENYSHHGWFTVMTARCNLGGALDRLPPVVVSVAEPAAAQPMLDVLMKEAA